MLKRSWSMNAASAEAERLQSETPAAPQLDILFRAHFARITRVIGRVIYDQARAEELAVDVFVKWWRNPSAHGDQAEGWIYRAAIRQALDELRRQTRRARFERLLSLVGASQPTPEQLHLTAVECSHTRAVLAVLDRRQAEVLLLRAEDLSYREIASSLGVNENYVGSLVARAQAAFRKEYEKRYGKQTS